MARRLLLGRAGTGKTHTCLDLLAEAEGPSLLLVPTYSQAEHLRCLLLDRLPGLRERAVETFETLAERATGLRLGDLVPPGVKDRLAERVLAPLFSGAAGQPGFRAEFLAAVKEIKEQGLAPQEALAKAQAHFDEPGRGRWLFEACARYGEALPGHDHEDLLLAARDRLAESYALVLVDGFHDFTPVQREIVDRLAARARTTVVTLPLDPDEPGHPIFATAARTAQAFAGYRREALRGNRRAQGVLADLEQRLFRPPRPDLPSAGLEVLACPSEEDEADRLARLVARSGRRCDDFLIVRRSFDGLHALYRAAFARHGVPLRFFGPAPLGHTPAARAVGLYLRTLLGPVETGELLPLLRSPYFLDRPPPEEADGLARRLREEGAAAFALPPAPQGPLGSLLRRRFGLRDALVETPDGDHDLAVAARLLAAVGKEADAVADLPLPEAAERVLRRLPHLRGAPPDRRRSCVCAVEATEARQWERPVVCVAGLTATSFPRQYRQDLFLRDDERRAFGEEQGLHLPLRARQEDEERYLFYVALTRARERLILSYAAFDEEGTPRSPSPYVEELRAHFEELEPRAIPLAEQYVPAREALSREDLLPIVADGLSRAHRGEGALAASLFDLGAVPRADLAWPRRLELARARPVRRLPRDPARRLSASGINDYLRCPYLFLMRRVLKVKPPREHRLDALVAGQIVHAALERVVREEGDPAGIFERTFAELTRGFRVGLAEEARRRWMRRVVLRVGHELRRRPPEDVECEFHVPVGDVELHGFIDRIDRYPAGQLVRDYKTGRADLADNVQLDAYLLATTEPAGAVFERLRQGDALGYVVAELKDEVRGKVEEVTRAQLAERQAEMRRIVGRVAAAARAGRLALRPRDPESCTRARCDGYDLCRVVRARWLAKGGTEEG
ncbi:MAG: PD-(D/E)XK nuclease family protein [Planctomycetota bacterium]